MSSSLGDLTTAKLQRQVYLGVWTDWSRGPFMGLTLTLKRPQGSLLIAFTAFFISLVASCFWRILVLFIHRLYSTPAPRDALHHQRQVLLRNSITAPSSFWAFSQLWWTWRRSGRDSLMRTLPVILCALFTMAVFAVAGGFSSQISSGISNAALLDGSRCGGILSPRMTRNPEDLAIILPYTVRRNSNAANYAQQCYTAQSAGMLDCATFVQQNLPRKINGQAPCPFKGGICRSNTSNLVLDTGYINSHQHLGVNYPPENRILFKYMLQCAPLETSGYSRTVATSSRNYTRYYYGHQRSGQDYTTQAKTVDEQYDATDHEPRSANSYPGFILDHAECLNMNRGPYLDNSDFNPIPELFRPDGDLSIFFLSGNGASFMRPTPDPWYRGTVPGKDGVVMNADSSDANMTFTLYRPEEAASPLACLRQYQFCNASHHCGLLGGYLDAWYSSKPFLNTSVLRTRDPVNIYTDPIFWFTDVVASGTNAFTETATSLRGNSLQSQQAFINGIMGILPDNQWQLDVTHWWNTALAAIQAAFVLTASGPTDPTIAKFNSTIDEPVFGLYITYITGTIIIVVSYTLEPILHYFRRWRNPNKFTYLEWSDGQTLQLQRAAYQGIGCGTWTGYTDAVPTTKRDEILADLYTAYTDPCHDERTEEGNNSLMPSASAMSGDDTLRHQASQVQESLQELHVSRQECNSSRPPESGSARVSLRGTGDSSSTAERHAITRSLEPGFSSTTEVSRPST
ncbi:hypothetical protein XA68_10660 [Ophiocordyceps unilateralis]|uniref:Uncharacterized protein n=1 Tax=Ophiocordyceps unilateralis TaxID=268505 RepID=A0A2A9PHB7_OPHUN|nr:hypothetical protein XA68_10660 [Ophiocordyceps unilateralis]